MELSLLPFAFLILILFAAFKPNPRIALMDLAKRREFNWGIFLVAIPASATVPVLMYFLLATGTAAGPGRSIVAALAVLAAVSAACLMTGLRMTRRALASVPAGKVKSPVGEDDLA